jgi:hypothetical protein
VTAPTSSPAPADAAAVTGSDSDGAVGSLGRRSAEFSDGRARMVFGAPLPGLAACLEFLETDVRTTDGEVAPLVSQREDEQPFGNELMQIGGY